MTDRGATLASSLKSSPIFGGLSDAEARVVAGGCVAHTLDVGARLFEEGQPGLSLWVVLAGTVVLTRQTPSGGQVEVGRAGPGELLGEMALLDNAPRSTTATALTEVQLLEMRGHTFRQLLGQGSPGASKLLHAVSLMLARRLRQVIHRLEDELLLDAEEDALLDDDSVYGATVRRTPGRPAPAAPAELPAADPASAPVRHGELWRVLWGAES